MDASRILIKERVALLASQVLPVRERVTRGGEIRLTMSERIQSKSAASIPMKERLVLKGE